MRTPDLALEWVFGVVAELLPRAGTPHLAELIEELELLRRWRKTPPPSAIFQQKAEDLWYREDRDVARTAMNRLCLAMAEWLCPDLEIGINWLWYVPSLLCQAGFDGELRTDLMEWCLADFERFTISMAPHHSQSLSEEPGSEPKSPTQASG